MMVRFTQGGGLHNTDDIAEYYYDEYSLTFYIRYKGRDNFVPATVFEDDLTGAFIVVTFMGTLDVDKHVKKTKTIFPFGYRAIDVRDLLTFVKENEYYKLAEDSKNGK